MSAKIQIIWQNYFILGFMFYFIHKIDTMASNNSGSLRSQAAFPKGYGYEGCFLGPVWISFPESLLRADEDRDVLAGLIDFLK